MLPFSQLSREVLHYVDQLAVCGAGRIAQFGSRVLVCKPAQAQQLAQALSPIELQIRRPAGEEEPPHFARAEKMAEFQCCHIDQEECEDPQGDGGKTVPREGRHQISEEVARRIELDPENETVG
jgi:hypothetical protein